LSVSLNEHEYVHANHWLEEHRQLIAHLRAQHLPGVDADDEALVSITVEQARLILVTAGGLLGLTLTQILGTDRIICIVPIYYEAAFLSIALFLGWLGLLQGATLRRQRVHRRYQIYNAHFDAHMNSLSTPGKVDLTQFDKVFDTAFTPERSTQKKMNWLHYVSATLTFLGIIAAATATVGTVMPDRCMGSVVGVLPVVMSR
jgi:hypothetical protein